MSTFFACTARRFASDTPLGHWNGPSGNAQAIVVQRLNYDPDLLSRLWPHFSFRLSLPQAMLVTMESQARWRIAEGLSQQRAIPNYLDVIYLDGLQEFSPESVSIIQ